MGQKAGNPFPPGSAETAGERKTGSGARRSVHPDRYPPSPPPRADAHGAPSDNSSSSFLPQHPEFPFLVGNLFQAGEEAFAPNIGSCAHGFSIARNSYP